MAHGRFIQLLEQKNILFVPDYVINAGGVIYAALAYDNQPEVNILKKVDAIQPRLLKIFEEAKERHLHTTDVANQMAKQRLQQA